MEWIMERIAGLHAWSSLTRHVRVLAEKLITLWIRKKGMQLDGHRISLDRPTIAKRIYKDGFNWLWGRGFCALHELRLNRTPLYYKFHLEKMEVHLHTHTHIHTHTDLPSHTGDPSLPPYQDPSSTIKNCDQEILDFIDICMFRWMSKISFHIQGGQVHLHTESTTQLSLEYMNLSSHIHSSTRTMDTKIEKSQLLIQEDRDKGRVTCIGALHGITLRYSWQNHIHIWIDRVILQWDASQTLSQWWEDMKKYVKTLFKTEKSTSSSESKTTYRVCISHVYIHFPQCVCYIQSLCVYGSRFEFQWLRVYPRSKGHPGADWCTICNLRGQTDRIDVDECAVKIHKVLLHHCIRHIPTYLACMDALSDILPDTDASLQYTIHCNTCRVDMGKTETTPLLYGEFNRLKCSILQNNYHVSLCRASLYTHDKSGHLQSCVPDLIDPKSAYYISLNIHQNLEPGGEKAWIVHYKQNPTDIRIDEKSCLPVLEDILDMLHLAQRSWESVVPMRRCENTEQSTEMDEMYHHIKCLDISQLYFYINYTPQFLNLKKLFKGNKDEWMQLGRMKNAIVKLNPISLDISPDTPLEKKGPLMDHILHTYTNDITTQSISLISHISVYKPFLNIFKMVSLLPNHL